LTLHFAAAFSASWLRSSDARPSEYEIDDETFCGRRPKNPFDLRFASASLTSDRIDASTRVAAARMGNQTHDEHLISADEQW
jgi:hypothetical protein